MALNLKIKKEKDLKHAAIVVACSNFVVRIDEDGGIKNIDSGRGIYYGVCKLGDGFVVGSRNNNKETLLLFFNKNFEVYKEVKIEEVVDLHEICYGYRKIWMTNTQNDNIISYDIDTFLTKEETWLGKLGHINSISLHNGNFYLAGLRNSTLRIVNHSETILEKEFLCSGLHTVKVFNDILYACNSNTCSVSFFTLGNIANFVNLDLKDKANFFARGIACDERNFYIGLSVRAERDYRHENVNSKICVVDKRDLSYKDIKLNSSGQIGDFILL